MIARRPVLAMGFAGFAGACLARMTAFLLLPARVGGGVVEAKIGSIQLRYLRDYARFPPGRVGGAVERLDLAAFFPGLAPAGSSPTFAMPRPRKIAPTERSSEGCAKPKRRSTRPSGR